MENPSKVDDLGVPLFQERTIFFRVLDLDVQRLGSDCPPDSRRLRVTKLQEARCQLHNAQVTFTSGAETGLCDPVGRLEIPENKDLLCNLIKLCGNFQQWGIPMDSLKSLPFTKPPRNAKN